MIKRLICLIVTFVTVFALFGTNKASAEESNDPIGPLSAYVVYVDGDFTQNSAVESFETEKQYCLDGSKVKLNYLCQSGYSDLNGSNLEDDDNVRLDIYLYLNSNTKLSELEFVCAFVDGIKISNGENVVFEKECNYHNFNYLNLSDLEDEVVDTLIITINDYSKSKDAYLVMNDDAKVYQDAYEFGYSVGFENGVGLGYDSGYTEGVRNNAETVIYKDNVPVDDNLIKTLIGLSGAVLLFGLIALCLFKMKKRRKK